MGLRLFEHFHLGQLRAWESQRRFISVLAGAWRLAGELWIAGQGLRAWLDHRLSAFANSASFARRPASYRLTFECIC